MKKNHGFSMVELMVVLVVLGLMTALAMPSYKAWVQNTRIRSTAESISNGLQVARNEAVRRNANVEFNLNAGDSGWSVNCVAVTPGCPDLDPIQSKSAGEGASASISVTDSDGLTVQFTSMGQMVSPAPGAGTRISFDVDVDTSVLPASESRDLRINVDTGGNVRLCDLSVDADDPRACP